MFICAVLVLHFFKFSSISSSEHQIPLSMMFFIGLALVMLIFFQTSFLLLFLCQNVKILRLQFFPTSLSFNQVIISTQSIMYDFFLFLLQFLSVLILLYMILLSRVTTLEFGTLFTDLSSCAISLSNAMLLQD